MNNNRHNKKLNILYILLYTNKLKIQKDTKIFRHAYFINAHILL